jgi:hypothetical protein
MFGLPELPPGFEWSFYLASDMGTQLNDDGGVYIDSRSVVILISKKNKGVEIL